MTETNNSGEYDSNSRRSFRAFLSASVVTSLGNGVAATAIPLLALVELRASDSELGTLRAVQLLPSLLLAVPIGVLVDRSARRCLMIGCDLARVVLLVIIIALASAGLLTLMHLLVLVFLVGTLSFTHELAGVSVVPALFRGERIQLANRDLEVGRSGAGLLGPAIGGALAGIISAASVLLLNCLTLIASAVLLAKSKWPEASRTSKSSGKMGLGQGFSFVRAQPLLFRFTTHLGVRNLALQWFQTASLLLVVQSLAAHPIEVGVFISAAAAGFMLSALIAPKVWAKVGVGGLVVCSSLAIMFGVCLVAASANIGFAVVGSAIVGAGSGWFNPQFISLRQALTPDHLLGRVSGVVKMVSYGAMAIGAALGGWTSSLSDPRVACWLAAAVAGVATALLCSQDVFRLRSIPS